jgi:Cyclic nucleotide-binding domain./Bacterial regulatory proteins, crp family.
MLDEKTMSEMKLAFPFARELGPSEDLLRNTAWLQQFEAGAVIMDQNQNCNGVVFVLSGTIKISKTSDEGREMTLYRIGRGETCILTVACLLGTGDVPFPVSACAEQDSTVIVIPVDTFRKLFFESPSVQKYIFASMSAKFYSVLGLLESVTFKRTSDRLMDFLITKTAGGTYPLYATHEAIASELGTAREVVSRLLKDMEGKGIVKLGRGKIQLLRP